MRTIPYLIFFILAAAGTPAAAQDIGAVRQSMFTATCDALAEGTLRWDATGKTFSYCNGTSWTNFGGATTPAGANTQIQFNSAGAFGANANFVWDQVNGRVGIGTVAPSAPLHVKKNTTDNYANTLIVEGDGEPGFALDTSSASASLNPLIWTTRSRGSRAAKTAVVSNDSLLEIGAQGYDGSANRDAAYIKVSVDGTVTGGGAADMPGRIEFHTQADGAGATLEGTTPEMVIKNNGYVGIGTASPLSLLHVAANVEEPIMLTVANSGTSSNPSIELRRARGTVTAPTALASGDDLAEFNAYGYNGSTYNHAGYLGFIVDGTVTGGGAADMPTRFEINVQADGAGGWMGDGATTPELVIKSNGNIGISTATPQSTLHVPNGKYAQFEDNNAGAPPAADCDADAERGRQSIDTTNNRLYICNGATRGWDYVALTN